MMLARMPPPVSTVPAGQLTVAVAKATGATGPVAIAWTTAGPLPGGRLAITCCAGLGGAAASLLALTAVTGRWAEQAASRRAGSSRSPMPWLPRRAMAVSVVDPVIGTSILSGRLMECQVFLSPGRLQRPRCSTLPENAKPKARSGPTGTEGCFAALARFSLQPVRWHAVSRRAGRDARVPVPSCHRGRESIARTADPGKLMVDRLLAHLSAYAP